MPSPFRSIHRADGPLHASVIIPNRDGRRWLETCLRSLAELQETDAFEVVVVDNGSTDGSPDWLAESWPTVRVLRLSANAGFARACNLGAAQAHAPILVFLNNDTVVRNGWLGSLLAVLDADPDVAIAGGLALFLERPELVNSAGVRIAASGGGIDDCYGEAASSIEPEPKDVAAVSGVSLAVRKSWFDEVGGFDERFFMYYEDVDLCLRTWLLGRRVRFVPGSIVLHAFSGTAGARTSPLKSRYVARNRLLTALKCFEPRALAVAVGLALAQDTVSVLAQLAHGRVRTAASVAFWKGRGIGDAALAIPHVLPERRELQRRRIRSDADLKRLCLIETPLESIARFVKVRRSPMREFEPANETTSA